MSTIAVSRREGHPVRAFSPGSDIDEPFSSDEAQTDLDGGNYVYRPLERLQQRGLFAGLSLQINQYERIVWINFYALWRGRPLQRNVLKQLHGVVKL